MTLTIKFNWPMDQRSATVTLGLASNVDTSLLFRMGIISKKDASKVSWLQPEWMRYEEAVKVKIVGTVDDLIVIDRKNITEDTILGRTKFDIAAEWPIEATGASLTTVNYII
jgi:hypothetical protein